MASPRSGRLPAVRALVTRCVTCPASWRLLLLAAWCVGVAATGCKRQAAGDAKKSDEPPPREAFDIDPPIPVLSQTIVSAQTDRPLRLAKPGHATAVVQRLQANFEDFAGRSTLRTVDDQGQTTAWQATPFELRARRGAVLAKERPKRLESELLLDPGGRVLRIESQVTDDRGGVLFAATNRWTAMPSYQYFLLVWARNPSRYGYLKVTDAILAPYETDDATASPHYRVALADGAKTPPLPASPLCWTSVAAIVWDDANFERLTPDQQQALIDWLHWGGRLVISGPDSLASLRGTALDPYLPAEVGATRRLSAAELEPLSQGWSQRAEGSAVAPLAQSKPWSGVELKSRKGAEVLPGCGGLLVERGVGAGSVVVSAMRLTERELINWRGFDGWLNGALLRRPSRRFQVLQDDAWAGRLVEWARWPDRARDAHFVTPLRWFGRDAGAQANHRPADVATLSAGAPPVLPGAAATGDYPGPRVDQPGGLGQWSDFGAVSSAAREALVRAAGVRVLGGGFVLTALAIYLLALVPLNWMIFSALRRVEWAWAAAPVIALVGAWVVVKQAQLDIGFVRAETEIGLLELYGDHPRGHVSRYTALYSSLSDQYELELNEASALAAPFPRQEGNSLPLTDEPTPAVLELGDRPRLTGLTVFSASTQLFHAEQMLPLEGPLRLSSPSSSATLLQLENKTQFDLADAMVLRRRRNDRDRFDVDGCWLGTVRRGSSTLLSWRPLVLERKRLPFADERRQAAGLESRPRLDVDELLKLACEFPANDDPLQGRRDEFRLVARLDALLPGLEVSPAPSQRHGATVVLARLRLGPAPPPRPDVNTPDDAERSPVLRAPTY